MVRVRRKAKQRTLVVGLDGVPFGLIARFTRDGTMPRLADIVGRGALARMTSALPEVSAVNWTSFMTGAGPGRHGIYGFTDLHPNSYRLRFPSFRDVKVPTIWDELGERGNRCVVINQPATYPARPIRGVLVSGFVAVEFDRSVYPPAYVKPLRDLGYELDIDPEEARKAPAYLFRKLAETLAGRERAVEVFWDSEDWDYFQVVITGSDRLFHYQWYALDDDSSPHHQPFLNYFRQVDGFIGRVFDRFQAASGRERPEEGFFLLSDHGFTGIEQEVSVNAWLREQGFLGYAQEPPESLEDLAAETRAFALDPGRIYVHRKGRYPRGSVAPDEVPAVKRALAEQLSALRFDGRAVIAAVHDGDTIYEGPETGGRPDLVVVPQDGFDLKGSVRETRLFARKDFQGMHTWHDAFFWSAHAAEPDLNITRLRGIIGRSLAGA